MVRDRFDHIQADIEHSQASAQFDRPRRKRALVRLEKLDLTGKRTVCVYYCGRHRSLSQYDILPFYSMLKSVDPVTDLDLVIVSPGGDGTAAESMLDLCRKYCRGKLRVIVPLYAKSAATLLALGGDEIVMGETSELGPIDAQVFIVQDNAEQQVSADHFLRAHNDAVRGLASAQPEEVQASQIQLSLIAPAFLQHCADLMKFAKDLAGKQLKAHMFRDEYAAEPLACEEQIRKIVENLTSSSRHLLHGRMITAGDIKNDPDLCHLKVTELASDDGYWTNLTELLLRTEIAMGANEMGKSLFARNFQLLSK